MSQMQRSTVNTNSLGKRVHDYVFIKELGKGAFGQVFQARNVVTEELVAIKCVPKIKLQEHNGIVDQLLKNEVSVLQQINHPHVVKLVTYMESVNQCYIVMEYCNSGDFEQYWKRRNKKIPEQEAIDFMKQILKGMQALHEKNVLHRDLKLANILIHNETLKIADLGFCKQLNDKNATERLSLGSLGNMAPEVVEQLPYGMQADMFSIGSIFYQLLYGAFPFSTTSQKQFLFEISQGRPDFRRNGVNISPQLQQLITKMLERDPRQRLTWTALYEDPIIIEKLDTRSIQININNMLARDIDVKGNQEFYKQVERSQLQPVIRQTQLKEIKVVEEDARPQNPQLIEIQMKLAEERTLQEKEVYEVTQKYMKSRNEIVYLTVTLEEINKVQHTEAVHGLLPCLLLTKKMAILSQKLINRILNGDNIFNTKYLDKVYQNKFFEQFQQVLIEENEYFQNSLQYYVNSAKSPNNKLEKHIQPAWRIEIQDDPSINFEQIFDECLRNYFFILQELLQKSKKNSDEQSQLMSTAIKIIDCLHYDKTIGKSQIVINRDEIDIKNKSYEQKKQILEEKTNLFLQNIQ